MKKVFTSLLLIILLLINFISYGQYKPGELALLKIEKLRSEYQPSINGNRGAPEQDCNSALAVCQSTYVQPSAYSGDGNQQEVPTGSCLGSLEKNSVWYIFTVQTSGTLTFTIDPNTNSDDYDFALYNITGKNCSDVKTGSAPEVRCNYCVDAGNTGISAAGANASEDCCSNSPGCQFSSILNVTVGQTYVLVVSNYTSSNDGYTLTFGGTSNIFDNVAATPVSAITPCGVNYLTLQLSEAVLCSSIAANGSDFTLTGPGGPFTVTGASGINCGNATSQVTVNFTPQVIMGSAYTLNVVTGTDANSLIDNCGNAVTGATSLTFTAIPPIPLITGPNSFCKGSNVTLSASIGTGFLWSNGATTQSITVSPLVTTTYSVTIQNGNCVQNTSHTLTVRPAPVANFTFSPLSPCAGQIVTFTNTSVPLKKCFSGGAYCTGASCGFLNPCIENPSLYVWEFGDGGTSTVKNPTHTYNTPGTYNVALTIIDFFGLVVGCSNKIIIPITVLPNSGSVTISGNNSICAGSSTTLTASNGSSYSWTSNPVGFTSTNPIITVSPLVNTTYTVTSPGCFANSSASVTVTVNPSATPTFVQVAPICAGGTLNALPTSSTNAIPITGTWAPALNNSATTIYTFTPTAGQCATSTTMTITVNPNITPTFVPITPICAGGTLNALPTSSTNAIPITGTWAPALNNSATTIYTFTPTSGQCATSTTMTITVNPNITPTFVPIAPICAGGTLNALPTSSTNAIPITGTWAPALNNSATTIYTFTPTAGQCATSTTMTITVNPNITPTFVPIAPICAGGTLNALPTSSTNAIPITGTWAPALNNSATTIYTFTPTAGQCATSTTMTITVNPNITPTFVPIAPICAGWTLNALPTSSTNAIPITGTWTPALNNSATTIYTFTPTAGQCATSTTMTITVNPNITPTFVPIAPICAGGTLNALPTSSTNAIPITGTWAPALNNSATTIYTFTPTAGQCATSTTMTITVNPNITPTFVPIAPICAGGTLNALPTSSTNAIPITGTWAPALNNSATTIYTFTPTAGQCATSTTMTITVNPNITPTFVPIAPICAGGTLNALPTSSTNAIPITGTWAPALNNSATTIYTFTPTAGQCATSTTMTITVNPNITPTFVPIAPICAGGTLNALPTSSTNAIPITGTWAPALNNSATTIYTFTPTAGQCATSTTMTITVNPNITPTFVPIAPICAGGTLNALPTSSNNAIPITGTWAPALNNSATTTYTFTPTAGQCATNTTMTITVNPNITPTFVQVAPICAGGTLNALPTSSTNAIPITGTWAPALNNSATTIYTFTPTAGQCATSTTMTITVNPNITPTFVPIAPICAGGTLNALPTSSTNAIPITGTWAPALNNSATTIYTFSPTAGQCATSTTMTITVNPNITPTFLPIAPICAGGTLNALPTSSNNAIPITGTWAPALNNSATTIYTFTPTSGQCATSTTMTITVNPNFSGTLDTTICNGASFVFNGTTYNATNLTGTETLIAANGCDSIVTVTATLLSIDAVTLTQTSCNPADVGTVVNTLQNQSGCDSVVTIVTTLDINYSITVNLSSCNPLDTGTIVQILTSTLGCDSIVTTITSLLISNAITIYQTSCNPADVGTVVNTLQNQAGCDSIVTTITTLLNSNTVTVNQTSCNPADVGTVVNTLQNQAGCDSVVTTITTLLNSNAVTVNQTSCNPSDVGTVVNTLQNQAGCDSVVTTITTLLNSNAITINQTSCNPADVGTVVNTLQNQAGCDSIVTTITTLLNSNTVTVNQTSCNPSDVGTVVNTLQNQAGCDSVVTTITTLLNSNAITINQTSCNPVDVGTVVNTLQNQAGCDSIVTIITTLNINYTSTVNLSSCNPNDTGTVVQTFTSVFGCDSIVTTITTLLNGDAVTINQTSCNPSDVGTVVNTFQNQAGCDSVVTTITTLLNSNAVTVNQTSCNPADVGTVVNTLQNQAGCDSVVTTITTLLNSNAVTVNQTSCNPADVGTVVNTLQNQAGCDSIVTIITTLNINYTSTVNLSSCNPNDTGTVVQTFTSVFGCDSIVTTITTLLNGDAVTINQTSCNPSDVGTVVNTFQNQAGCDSVVTTITTLLNSNTVTVNQTSCNPSDVGTVVNTLQNQAGCDSVVTIVTTLDINYSLTVNLSSCNPIDTGTVVQTLTSTFGCDSIVTTITSLLNSNAITINQTSCNPADVGTVVITLQNQAGCDSVVTTITTLLNSNAVTVNQTSCNPADVGTVVNTLQNQAGCDSIVTIITTLNINYTSTVNLSSCNPNDTGTVVQTFTSVFGCDSIVTTITTLLNGDAVTINQTSCNPADVGTVVNTLQNQAGCDSVVTTITTLLNSNAVTVNQTSCNPADVGTVVNTLQNQAGCDSVVTIITTLDINYSLTVNLSSCNPNDTGIVVQTLISTFGCDSIVTTITTLLNSNAVTINQTSCNPADVGTVVTTLQNQAGCDSVVTTVTTLDINYSLTVNLSSCNPNDTGIVVQTLISTFGCDSIVTTITTLLNSNAVTINQTSCNPADVGTVVNILQNQAGCDSVVTTITTLLNSNAVTVNQTSCNQANVGTVVNTLQNQAGCDSVVTTTTTLLTFSLNSILTNNANCSGVNGAANILLFDGTPPFQYILTDQSGNITNVINPISPMNSGNYEVTITDANGCQINTNFTINENTASDFSVSPAISNIDFGDSVQFQSIPSIGLIHWEPSDFLSCDTCPNPISFPDVDISYIISLDDGLGCISIDTVFIKINEPGIFIPTGFTPNGDGNNDVLYIIDKNITELVYFRIYNRWGEEIFATDDLYQGWDGFFKSEAQEMDVYVYDLEVILFTGQRAQVSGTVALIR